MFYLIYSNCTISCPIGDRDTLYEFARITEKEEKIKVVGVVRVKENISKS